MYKNIAGFAGRRAAGTVTRAVNGDDRAVTAHRQKCQLS